MANSVFHDLTDTPDEAANLTARGMLMIALEQRINEEGWTQAQAARMFHVTQPRVSDLLNGKIDKFSLDALVNMLPAVGLTIDVRPADLHPLAAHIGDSRSQSNRTPAGAAHAPARKAAKASKAQKQVAKKIAGKTSAAKKARA